VLLEKKDIRFIIRCYKVLNYGELCTYSCKIGIFYLVQQVDAQNDYPLHS